MKTTTNHRNQEMKIISVKLTPELDSRTELLTRRTGISRSALIRQAILAGLPRVEEGMALIQQTAEEQPQPA